MRLWIVVVLVACHHADAPAPVAPRGPTQCARASDSMVQSMLTRLPAKDSPPTEEADALRNLIRERCEQDGWSAEAVQCLIGMQRLEDAAGCAKLMTDDQQAALVRDEAARFGAPPGPSGTGAAAPAPSAPAPSPPSGQAPPAAQPAPAAPAALPPPAPGVPAKDPAKPRKTKNKGDPCDGGE